MTAAWTTSHPAGNHPAGMRVDIITLTLADKQDGQWIRVRRPNGILIGLVRSPAELPALGIDLASLEPAPARTTCRRHHHAARER